MIVLIIIASLRYGSDKHHIHALAASTHDKDVFSFYSDERFCNGFEEVLSRYKEIVPHLRLAGLNFTSSTCFNKILIY